MKSRVAIMDIVKKNVLSILCGVVILLAIIALFWPIGGMIEGAQQKAKERADLYNKLDTVGKKSRKLPVTTLASDAPESSLEQFPGPKVIEAGQVATKAMVEQSAGVLAAAVAMNQHPLLTPGSLPSPSSDLPKYQFREAYKKRVKQTLPVEVLKSTLPPTDKDLEEAEAKLWTDKYVGRIVYKTEPDPVTKVDVRTPLNYDNLQREFLAEADKLPEQIRTNRAEQFQMYVDDGAIAASDVVINEGPPPTPDQIWYAQNALWVEEDVCRAIAQLNATAKNTLTSPVKRLLSLNVSPTLAQYVLPAPAAAASADAPAPTADPNAAIERKFDRSPTGRVSNPLYDVITFNLEVCVDARMITPFLTELGRERFFSGAQSERQPGPPGTFITVNKVDIIAVNKTEALQAGFVYGEAPVMKLTLQCEALLFRQWTVPLMPADVKKALNITDPAKTGEAASAQAN